MVLGCGLFKISAFFGLGLGWRVALGFGCWSVPGEALYEFEATGFSKLPGTSRCPEEDASLLQGPWDLATRVMSSLSIPEPTKTYFL